jgi:2-dehydro-3-deoxygluconokinase
VSHDIVTIGEAMLRLWVPAGERLETAPSFRVAVAGSEANVAISASRMGARTAWLSALPDNPLGHRAAREVAQHGVDVDHISWAENGRMGLFFIELSGPPRPVVALYDRENSPATSMSPSDVEWPVLENARIVHISGITPALSESARSLSIEVVRRSHNAGAMVSIDVNYRRKLWEPHECAATIVEMAAHADVLIATTEDARDVFGFTGTPDLVLRDLQDLAGTARVVLTAGADGAFWLDGSGAGFAAGYAAETVDRIGAGDAFAAGTLVGLLEGDFGGGVERGTAMAALKLGIYGDQLNVTRDEVDRLMKGHSREVSR